ncbi:MAG: transglycosylase SLT domain-containing protein [Nanoarchaeota archaeon]|nr:transglycosylase SLT domain-containing protein [Nanoarchaeota archaeon]
MMKKKGQIFVITITIFVFIALTSLFIVLNNKYENKDVTERKIGDYQSAIANAFLETEMILNYLDIAAKKTAYESIEEMGEHTGTESTNCGEYNYNLLNTNKNTNCFGQWTQILEGTYEEILEKKLKSDSSKVIFNHDVDISAHSQNPDDLIIYGYSKKPQDMIISKTGFISKDTSTGMTTLDSNIQTKIDAYEQFIEKYASEEGIPVPLIKSLIYHESKGWEEANSTANALGLMQIVPFDPKGVMVNHNFSVKTSCKFTKADTIQEFTAKNVGKEYFDPEKNICCGVKFLKEKMEQKKEVTWNCCGKLTDKGTCVRKIYDNSYEIGLRLYNGGACGNWVDPDYVETIGAIYQLYTGVPLSPENYGTYSFDTNFATSINFNLEVYDEIVVFSENLIKDCTNNVFSCINKQIEDFNKQHETKISFGHCEEGGKKVLYDFAENIIDCQNAQKDECLCKVNEDYTQETIDEESLKDNYEIKFKEEIIATPIGTNPDKKYILNLTSHDNITTKFTISDQTFWEPTTYTFEYDTDEYKDGTVVFEDSSGNLHKLKNFDNLYLYKKGQVFEFATYKNNMLETPTIQPISKELDYCLIPKNKYSFCAKTKYEKPVVKDKKYTYEPINIKFSLTLPGDVPPKITITTQDHPTENNAIILTLTNIKRTTTDVEYYNIYCSQNSFSGTVKNKQADISLIPTDNNEIIIKIGKCNGRTIQDDTPYYFVVTAVDKGQNENQDVTETSVTSKASTTTSPTGGIQPPAPTQPPIQTTKNFMDTTYDSGKDYGLFYSRSEEIFYPSNVKKLIEDKANSLNLYINIYASEDEGDFKTIFELNKKRSEKIRSLIKKEDDKVQVAICNKGSTNKFSQDNNAFNRRFEITIQDTNCINEIHEIESQVQITSQDEYFGIKFEKPEDFNTKEIKIYYSQEPFEYYEQTNKQLLFKQEDLKMFQDKETTENQKLYYDHENQEYYFRIKPEDLLTQEYFSIIISNKDDAEINYGIIDLKLINPELSFWMKE